MNILRKFKTSELKVIAVAALGGALEFYDFMIFAFLANTISPQYFPATQHINSLLGLFGAFTVGYLARPIGGLIFSHYGDLQGRKKAFYFSILLMAIPSLLIALLPNYQHIGVIAPLTLVLLRVVQGLAVGGEIPGAITFTIEHIVANKRGRAIVLIFFALSLAVLFGQSVTALLHYSLTETQFYHWGWRIAFLIGSILGVVGGYMRKNISETPLFKAAKSQRKESYIPIVYLLKNHFLPLLQGLSILCLDAVSMFLLFLYMPTYLINFKLHNSIPVEKVHLLNSVSLAIFSVFMLLFGYLSDVVGRKKLILIGSLLLIVLPYPMYKTLLNGSTLAVLFSLVTLGVSFSLVASSYGAMLAELFPAKVRYTGVGLVYNLAFAAFGGTTPLITTYLIKVTQAPIMPAYYLMLLAVLSLLGTLAINTNKLN
ncbi:MFS transporter [Parashewanella spongiae]|uniref:MFS transporter n=1 Tax=Parashewanella spongiae TaxID=342950 RepID=A0A3A6TMH4_9GAMM|nr:MFS transporter [Parashewanella spongiae]MCL1078712.1 MFS transporter [Parashewanella spongiae]RJY12283.1 MFS transporter [Parashewanella spongiae]